MKKPEKQKIEDKGFIGQFGHWSNNKAIDVYETYHLWDIKTNYIHKDKLSVDKIKEIIRRAPITNAGVEIDLATELSKELQRNDKQNK